MLERWLRTGSVPKGGSHIFWNDKKGKCGGYLDVDMNASKKNLVDAPIENLFWDKPPAGHYRIWVENNTSRNDEPTPFSVRLTKDGDSEDKSFDDCEEMEEVECFELYVSYSHPPSTPLLAVAF